MYVKGEFLIMKEMLLGFFLAIVSLFLLLFLEMPQWITGFQLQLIYLAFFAMVVAVFGRVVGWI